MILFLAKAFFWILGILFFVGLIGSGVVVILTSIQDVKELRDENGAERSAKMMPDEYEQSIPAGHARRVS